MSTRRHQNPPSPADFWQSRRLHAFLKERWQALVSKVQHTSGVAAQPAPSRNWSNHVQTWQLKITIGHPEKPWSLKAQRNESLGLQVPFFGGYDQYHSTNCSESWMKHSSYPMPVNLPLNLSSMCTLMGRCEHSNTPWGQFLIFTVCVCICIECIYVMYLLL